MKYQYMRDHFVRKMNGYPETEESARKWQYFEPLLFLRDEVLKKRSVCNADCRPKFISAAPKRSSPGNVDVKLLAADECLPESDDNQPLSAAASTAVFVSDAGTNEALASNGRPAPKRRCTPSASGDQCSSSSKEKSLTMNYRQQETPSTSAATITERYVNTLESLIYQRLAVCQMEETEEQHMGTVVADL
uniref:MADF domain-containing protein n=1 Tax=Romanomermis culicivorax TaxID=13658 RepID=A0A915I7D2_ROMCU